MLCTYHILPSTVPVMDKDNRLMEGSFLMGEADWGGNWVLFWWAMLSKSLIQLSVDGWGCVLALLFDLRPKYGGGNEDNGDLLQKVPCSRCCTQYPQPCRRPLPTHASTGDSWTLMGKSGSVSCGVTGPFSWALLHTSFYLWPLRVCFHSPM